MGYFWNIMGGGEQGGYGVKPHLAERRTLNVEV